jgi:hypothetical protein
VDVSPLHDVADQSWLRQPSTAELLEQRSSLRMAAAWGWLAAAFFACLYLFA